MSSTFGRALAVFAVAALLAGCSGSGAKGEQQNPAPVPQRPAQVSEEAVRTSIEFTETAAAAGIDFVHNDGSFGEKWLPETMGSGCGWLDYDGDGDPDALLLSGKDFPGHPSNRRQTMALYRNDGGTFTDVTSEAGLADPTYAIGLAIGDYDNDGDPDIYVTALGANRLYRNDGARFRDIAKSLGVDDAGFGSSATWVDVDNDGDLDLFALNYVQWSPESDLFCSLDGTNKSYCTPEPYRGASPRLWRNDGERFTDITKAAGVYDETGKGLGVLAFDYDADGWMDLFVANDTQPNFLYRNNGDHTFSEEGVLAGVAFDENGRARGAMGVDAADYDGSGRMSLVIGNFSSEMLALYHNEGAGFFIDEAPRTSVGRGSLLTLAFGVFYLDVNLDGWPDIFVGNGHVENEIQKIQQEVSYAQRPHLFVNLSGKDFLDVADTAGDLATPIVARGAASADYDGDGDLDILVNVGGRRARLYRNDSKTGNWVKLRLEGGAGSSRDGYGARIEIRTPGRTRSTWARASHSYGSQSDRVLTLGLGPATAADTVRVTWPSGRTSTIHDLQADQMVDVREASAEPAS